jgi:uncharacterized protein involved in tellurium resistance
MSEITLKQKISLKRKGEAAPFTFNEKMQVEMVWSSGTDLDLCLFWKTKNGEEGGVFSNEYNQNINDLGSLEKFPFIKHSGDAKTPRPGGEEYEQIRIKNIDSLSELHIIVLNYEAAVQSQDVTFNEHSARVEITTDAGDNLEVQIDDEQQGHVYWICSIENNESGKKAINRREVLSIGHAFSKIPGFHLITNS